MLRLSDNKRRTSPTCEPIKPWGKDKARVDIERIPYAKERVKHENRLLWKLCSRDRTDALPEHKL